MSRDEYNFIIITQSADTVDCLKESEYTHLKVGDMLEDDAADKFILHVQRAQEEVEWEEAQKMSKPFNGSTSNYFVGIFQPSNFFIRFTCDTGGGASTNPKTIYETQTAIKESHNAYHDSRIFEEQLNTTRAFFKKTLMLLCPNALSIQEKIISELIVEYKNTSSSGILYDDDCLRSQWNEYGEIMSNSQSYLYKSVNSSIRGDINAKIQKLCFLEKLALQFEHNENELDCQIEYTEESTVPEDLLYDDDGVIEYAIMGEITERALRDYEDSITEESNEPTVLTDEELVGIPDSPDGEKGLSETVNIGRKTKTEALI